MREAINKYNTMCKFGKYHKSFLPATLKVLDAAYKYNLKAASVNLFARFREKLPFIRILQKNFLCNTRNSNSVKEIKLKFKILFLRQSVSSVHCNCILGYLCHN